MVGFWVDCRIPLETIGTEFARVVRIGPRNENHLTRTTMAKKKGGRGKKKAETVFLVCQETGDYNYALRRKSGGEKLKLNKYSPRLRKHTLHVEKKK